MRLARLTLTGFKSFADRTEFSFDAPISAIVGPNGCGKSNVVDAIKWVLGERSAKTLRGKEMADVIFSGSVSRKPAGMASVVLTFDNPPLEDQELAQCHRSGSTGSARDDTERLDEELSDASSMIDRSAARRRLLPIDTDTVDVERRLYRDGRSQYIINNRKARLRDIRDLFLDTGIGADAYSIIEQGKVDAMLVANPYDRRTLFEEAAGVARFKVRRIEAQRKLERTEVNLVRVREQLDSTERRLRRVRSQAARARQFKTLDGEYRSLRAAVAFDRYDDLRQRLDGLTSRLQEMESQRSDAIECVRALEEAKQEAELSRHDLGEQQRQGERELEAAQHRAESARQRRLLTIQSNKESEAAIEGERGRLGELEARVAQLDEALDRYDSDIEQLESQLAQAEADMRRHTAERETAQESLAHQRMTLAQHRGATSDLEREVAAQSARFDADQRRKQALTEQTARLGAQIEALDREQTEVRHAIDAAQQSQDEHRKEIQDRSREMGEKARNLDELAGDQRDLTARVSLLEQERARLDSRRATLSEMVETHVGLGDAARDLLQRRDEPVATGQDPEPTLGSIIGPLVDLIAVDGEDAVVVEAALGSAVQALAVSGDPRSFVAQEVDTLVGRVTLVPINTSDADSPSPLHERLPEGVQSVLDLVRCGPGVRRSLRAILGTALIARDLEEAHLLSGVLHPNTVARIVTRRGEVLEADGRITAGPLRGEQSGAGMIQRRSELATLEGEVARIEVDVQSERSALAQLNAQAAAANQDLDLLRRELAEHERALAQAEARLQRHEAERDRLVRQRAALVDEQADGMARLEQLAAQGDEAEEKISSLRRLLDEEHDLVRQAELAIDTAQSAVDQAGERLTAAKVEVSQKSEQLASARRERRAARTALEDLALEQQRLKLSIEQRQVRLVEATDVITAAEQEIDGAEKDAQVVAGQIESVREQLAGVIEQAQVLAGELAAARQHTSIVDRDWNSLELSKRELEVRRETLEQRTSEDLSIDLVFDYADYRAMMASGDVARIDQEEASATIEGLRAQISGLGNVNLDAIEEESQLEHRNEELVQQVGDIDRARDQLDVLIARLSDVSRDRFKESFETICGHFSGRDGMFRKLFGGGRAEIKMIPDPETGEIDWLESGIEVTAKPPGKEPRSINQLSGGEKTMTAVALLMAIFQSKPSPFCVLDEVDAALDDANVERFVGIVRQFLHRSHFIIITHNKRTMHVADQLYGVTMQQRGVSKRVGVRFEQAGEDGELTFDVPALSESDETGDAPAIAAPSVRDQLASMRSNSEPVGVGADHDAA